MRLEAEFSDCAVVLSGTGAVFSAGLDFDHHFPLFARHSLKEIDACEVIGHETAAPPTNVTNSRRLMAASGPGQTHRTNTNYHTGSGRT